MVSTNKSNYGKEAYGSDHKGEISSGLSPFPTYDAVRRHFPTDQLTMLSDPEFKPRYDLTSVERRAMSSGYALVNHAESQRTPGWDKVTRALTRHALRNNRSDLIFNADVNPAVGKGGAKKVRDILSGKKEMHPDLVDAVIEDMSPSSDPEKELRPWHLRKARSKVEWNKMEKRHHALRKKRPGVIFSAEENLSVKKKGSTQKKA